MNPIDVLKSNQDLLEEKSRWIPFREAGMEEDGHIQVFGPVQLPVLSGRQRRNWEWFTFRMRKQGTANLGVQSISEPDDRDHDTCSILWYRDPSHVPGSDCIVRIHSACATGDLFGSLKCDCGPQLRKAMDVIYEHGEGLVFYLADQEGRGIGLFAKAMAYLLQQNGLNTFEANTELKYQEDMRTYGKVAALLREFFGHERIRLLTNNPDKVKAMVEFGITVTQLPLITPSNPSNFAYLQAKATVGHSLPQFKTANTVP